MAWLHHKRDTSHVTKVYFIELHAKITYVNSDDKFLIKNPRDRRFSASRLLEDFSNVLEKNRKMNIEWLLQKLGPLVRQNTQQEAVGCIRVVFNFQRYKKNEKKSIKKYESY